MKVIPMAYSKMRFRIINSSIELWLWSLSVHIFIKAFCIF